LRFLSSLTFFIVFRFFYAAPLAGFLFSPVNQTPRPKLYLENFQAFPKPTTASKCGFTQRTAPLKKPALKRIAAGG
jgi:hypothetical protein